MANDFESKLIDKLAEDIIEDGRTSKFGALPSEVEELLCDYVYAVDSYNVDDLVCVDIDNDVWMHRNKK